MSRRFGRNQRRRAREAIAALQANEAALTGSLAACQSLLHAESRRVQQLLGEIESAKRIAGEMSILFPAQDNEGPELEPRDRYEMSPRVRFDASTFKDAATQARKFQRMSLPALVASVDHDALTRAVHARITYDGIPVAYAAAPETLLLMRDRGDLAVHLKREIAHQMAPLLADLLQQRRGRRAA